MTLGTILIIILILLLIGAIPNWGYSRGWGYGPSGGLGLVQEGETLLHIQHTGRRWRRGPRRGRGEAGGAVSRARAWWWTRPWSP